MIGNKAKISALTISIQHCNEVLLWQQRKKEKNNLQRPERKKGVNYEPTGESGYAAEKRQARVGGNQRITGSRGADIER